MSSISNDSAPAWEQIVSGRREESASRLRLQEMSYLESITSTLRFRVAMKSLSRFLSDPFALNVLRRGWSEMLLIYNDQHIVTVPFWGTFCEWLAIRIARLRGKTALDSFGDDRPFNQLPCTVATAQARAAEAKRHVDLNDPVLLIGDDDLLSVELARQGFRNISVVEIDPNVLERIQAQSRSLGLQIRCFLHDVQDPPPSDAFGNYKLVFMDPMYSVEGVKMFLGAAMNLQKGEPIPTVFLSLSLIFLGASEYQDLLALLRRLNYRISTVYRGFNQYVTPASVRMVLHLARMYATGWRGIFMRPFCMSHFRSDLLILEANSKQTS